MGAARVEIRGSIAIYSAVCHDGLWEVELSSEETAATVSVVAISADGEVLARDLCILVALEPRRVLRGWRGRLTARRSRATGHGMVDYGPD